MAFTKTKTMVAAVILATVCIGSTAHAADSFNKFPEQATAATTQAPTVTTYVTQATSKSKDFAKKRRVKRVVEPVATSTALVLNAESSRMSTRFNKMVTQGATTSREMPVINKHASFVR